MELINVGFGNMVAADRIVSIVDIDSAPIKRAVALARENGTLIDATQGRKTKSVIFMDSDHIVLSYLTIEKLEQNRVE